METFTHSTEINSSAEHAIGVSLRTGHQLTTKEGLEQHWIYAAGALHRLIQ